jgi:CRISPR type III-B/RAMP module-associated protein Cmr3
MSREMPRFEIGIEPLEPLLFGDNRSARTGESHLLGDQDPSPVTLFGAVGTRILHALGARGRSDWSRVEAVLGPFLKDLEQSGRDSAQLVGFALRDAAGKSWFPAPLHLRVRRGDEPGSRLFGLNPARPADSSGEILSSVPTGRRLEAQPADDEADEELFVDEWLLTELLTGSGTLADKPLESITRKRDQKRDQIFTSEPRLGLAIDNHRGTAVPGVLFARPYRRFSGRVDDHGRWSGAGFVAWMELPGTGGREPGSFDGVGFLGGDRRRAWFSFSRLETSPLERIKAEVAARLEKSRGFLVYLLTPLPVDAELPAFPWQGQPVAAAVGRSRPVSGWNAQTDSPGPRKIRTLIPAGSVYFFEWSAVEAKSMAARQELLDRHWLQPVEERYRNGGFGRMLVGVWE